MHSPHRAPSLGALLTLCTVCVAQALVSFEAQQARGAWQNELCEKYYRSHPRAPDGRWPSEKSARLDVKLRDMLAVPFGAGAKIADAASSRLEVRRSATTQCTLPCAHTVQLSLCALLTLCTCACGSGEAGRPAGELGVGARRRVRNRAQA